MSHLLKIESKYVADMMTSSFDPRSQSIIPILSLHLAQQSRRQGGSGGVCDWFMQPADNAIPFWETTRLQSSSYYCICSGHWLIYCAVIMFLIMEIVPTRSDDESIRLKDASNRPYKEG